jgi:hypothetical protein
MTDFQIKDEDLTGFKGKVAIITGNINCATQVEISLTIDQVDPLAWLLSSCYYHSVHQSSAPTSKNPQQKATFCSYQLMYESGVT